MTTIVRKIARYGVRDLVRSRWLLGYAGFFAAATWSLLRFSDTETKALLSLVNVVLLVVPLANLIFGAMYLYGAREFVELFSHSPSVGASSSPDCISESLYRYRSRLSSGSECRSFSRARLARACVRDWCSQWSPLR